MSEARGAFAARAILFGLLGTAVLLGPALLGLRLAPWNGLDGGLAALLLLGVASFGWPPPSRRSLSSGSLDLAVAAAVVASFLALASQAAGGLEAGAGAVSLAAGLVLLGRLGGVPGALAAVLLVGLLGSITGPQAETPVARPAVQLLPVTLRLEGPLEAADLHVGEAPPLELETDLEAGATRRLRAWIPAPLERAPGAVTPRVESARPEGAEARIRVEPAPDGALDPVLAARRRPPVPPEVRAAPPVAAWLGAWAGLLVTLGLRGRLRSAAGRKFWPTALVGLWGLSLASGLGWAASLPSQPSLLTALGLPLPPAPRVRTLEGTLPRGAWLQIDRVRTRLAFEVTGDGRAAIELEGTGLRRCRLVSSADAGEHLELDLERGTVADLIRPFEPGLRVLQPAINGWGDMGEAWVRQGPLGWRGTGAWTLGTRPARVDPRPASGPRPAQGVSLGPPPWGRSGSDGAGWSVLGRLCEGAFMGLSGPDGAGLREAAGATSAPEVWVRLTSTGPAGER